MNRAVKPSVHSKSGQVWWGSSETESAPYEPYRLFAAGLRGCGADSHVVGGGWCWWGLGCEDGFSRRVVADMVAERLGMAAPRARAGGFGTFITSSRPVLAARSRPLRTRAHGRSKTRDLEDTGCAWKTRTESEPPRPVNARLVASDAIAWP